MTSRLTVELNASQTEFLNNYCERQGVTKAQALRQAIQLQTFGEQARTDGFTFGAFSNCLKREFVQS